MNTADDDDDDYDRQDFGAGANMSTVNGRIRLVRRQRVG